MDETDMKKIDHKELYQNLRAFLKAKGISLDEGSYTQRIQQGCDLLTDVINTTQKTVVRARVNVDRTMDRLRQSIHEATAPKPPAAAPGPPAPDAPAPPPRAKTTTRRRKSSSARPKS
jgi:hypothetical protein